MCDRRTLELIAIMCGAAATGPAAGGFCTSQCVAAVQTTDAACDSPFDSPGSTLTEAEMTGITQASSHGLQLRSLWRTPAAAIS